MTEPRIFEEADTVEDAWECERCDHVYETADQGEPTCEFGEKQGEFSCPKCGAPEDEQSRVFAKPTDQGTLAAWTYPGMDRDEYLESKS